MDAATAGRGERSAAGAELEASSRFTV